MAATLTAAILYK